MPKKARENPAGSGAGLGIGGILKGLADLVEKLDEVSESAGAMSKTGKFGDRELKGIYGFTVKVGLGGEGTRVEPFGNLRKDARSGHTVVQEVREPVVDVFEEEDYVLVVAEMPGISAADVNLEIEGDLLTIAAARGDKKYRKEVQVPGTFTRKQLELSCNNGVVEIKCRKA